MAEETRTEAFREIREERIKKKSLLEEKGIDPYPARVDRTHEIQALLEQFTALEESEETVAIAGRVFSIREHGGSLFFDLFDGTGSMQGYCKQDAVGKDIFDLFKDTVDRGDFVQVKGTCFLTKRGERSVHVTSWHMLSKSLLPIPTEHFGIKDEEERYRKRYLDILLNRELANRFARRSTFWQTARQFLLDRNYIEVETPVLETIPGGADAKPFITHHNALGMDVYLRISAGELWQKKLMVAGIPKTFEIGRIFRNEGMSFEHAQDYTQLEFYEAYSDFEKGKAIVKELYLLLAEKTFGKTSFTVKGHTFDLSAPWEAYDYVSMLKDAYGIDVRNTSIEEVQETLRKAGIAQDADNVLTKERGVDLLWKKCRSKISGPGFLVGVPVYLEPLAKKSAHDASVVERFQVIIAGTEMGKGFSELNDPLDQRARFLHQAELRASGDEEAQFADMEYVEALEYGMPPTFGFGLSERLFSFLEGVSLREGQIFPLLRPKK